MIGHPSNANAGADVGDWQISICGFHPSRLQLDKEGIISPTASMDNSTCYRSGHKRQAYERAAWELCLKVSSLRAHFPRPVSTYPKPSPSSLIKSVPTDHIISFVDMAPCNLSSNVPGTAWYFDSAPDECYSQSESEKGVSIRQPWRAYWPPKSNKMKLAWSRSEFPAVLTWRFDRSQPFDRPWRIWARSTNAMSEKAKSGKCF